MRDQTNQQKSELFILTHDDTGVGAADEAAPAR
jgi:hypothetical protein